MKGYIYLGKELIEKVENITEMDYETKGDLIEVSNLVEMLEDLVKRYKDKIYEKSEEIDNLEQQLDYAINGY